MTPEEFAKAPLSAVIRVALEDLARVEADPRYEVNMGVWHDNFGHGRCHVCLAGAVIAGTMGVPPTQKISAPEDAVSLYTRKEMSEAVADGVQTRLTALDFVRIGDIGYALIWADQRPPKDIEWPPVTPYEDDPAAFRRDLLAVAAALEERGL